MRRKKPKATTTTRKVGQVGRPLTEFTSQQWKELEEMARDQCTVEQMAAYLGVDKGTLYAPHHRDRFLRVTSMSRAKAQWEVMRNQRKRALQGAPVPFIWWGKQHLGQRDRHEVEHGDKTLEAIAGAGQRLGEMLEKLGPRLAKLKDGDE